jgi:hypothetical protein
MTYTQFQPFYNPRPFFIDQNGNPLVGAKLAFYASGGDTPLLTYSELLLPTLS